MVDVVVSGYFTYPHVGHVRMFEAARKLGDRLVVIVNNEEQQKLKYGKVITPVENVAELIKAFSAVDDVFISVDEDRTICKSLEQLKPDIFANGGDRSQGEIPEAEVCNRLGIKMVDGVGGENKADSSSRLMEELKKV